ncbi:HAD-IIIC family phosphatase [Saccharothrix yanglingensis]|uniref:Methoxymalonate biosynthesis protein n=1 Tax=Saccharothrix yanglingensis TaxID=659496 RepID=A0ABU0X998_9PSEU|nr:HAD-IIIC family phosphatase [Saccharothrix yanglingensis]MDQ2588700.1 hypothetical protein [Saccharothrix yanglingensis]
MDRSTALVKCLVWDLDNTLWQGTLLEDGGGALRDDVLRTVTALDERGVLQAVASRNDHDHAWARLEALGVAEYFVVPRIGWGPKSAAVREIADELGFALGTIAFVDDQPAERAEVAHHLPEVRCFTHDDVPGLLDLPDFTPDAVTEDSRRRRAMYQAGRRRTRAKEEFAGADRDFLRSLEMRMGIRRAGPEDLTRVAELTLRTSQMNATGIHYPDAVLRELLDDPAHEVLVATMDDRFGAHGAIGVLLVEKHDRVWRLKLLATSCRVVAFGAGAVILTWLADQAYRAGVHLAADFRRTGRNRVMEVAYRFSGYTDDPCPCLDGIAADDAPDAPGDGQRLHLLPAPQPPPATMALYAPELMTVAVR